MVTETAVLGALTAVKDPDLHRDIVSLGFIKNLRSRDVPHRNRKRERALKACRVRLRFERFGLKFIERVNRSGSQVRRRS